MATFFTAVRESNKGISDSTTSVFIITSFPAITAGKLYSPLNRKYVLVPADKAANNVVVV